MPTATQLRSEVAEVADLAQSEVDAILDEITNAVQAREALHDVLPEIVLTYGADAALVAADWYDDTRLERGVGGRFRAIPADLGTAGAEALAGWGSGVMFREDADVDLARSLVNGGLQRRVANYARVTVMRSSVADPRAKGWQRTGSPKCDFCRMLIGRGAVYREETAHFDAHDHCNCGAEPAWR